MKAQIWFSEPYYRVEFTAEDDNEQLLLNVLGETDLAFQAKPSGQLSCIVRSQKKETMRAEPKPPPPGVQS